MPGAVSYLTLVLEWHPTDHDGSTYDIQGYPLDDERVLVVEAGGYESEIPSKDSGR